MKEYSKIQTIFKRDMSNKGALIIGQYSRQEFEYLKGNEWLFTEKVDGTNIRVDWKRGVHRKFGGRTDNAQIPVILLEKLEDLFPPKKFADAISSDDTDSLCLYGEGYGARIQKGGGNYKSDGVDFVLFDVLVDDWWLQRDDVQDVADKLGIRTVPQVGRGTLEEAIIMTKLGFGSTWGNFKAEGLVLRPSCELKTRAGNRIITKIKHKDFK